MLSQVSPSRIDNASYGPSTKLAARMEQVLTLCSDNG
jgi:hypothetical protein